MGLRLTDGPHKFYVESFVFVDCTLALAEAEARPSYTNFNLFISGLKLCLSLILNQ